MAFQNPFKKRIAPAQFRRRSASGRGYTAPQSNRNIARSSGGGSRPVDQVYQNDLKLGTRWVVLSLTATANATPVIFDFMGVSTRTLTNVTVGGTFGVNTESALRQLMGSNPFKIGMVKFKASVASLFGTMNAQFIQKKINGEAKTVPVPVSALEDPTNYQATLLVADDLDLIGDSGLAFTCTLLNGEVLTMTFAVPMITDNYAMSR